MNIQNNTETNKKAKEVVALLDGMSIEKARTVLNISIELLKQNSYVSVQDKFVDLPTVFGS